MGIIKINLAARLREAEGQQNRLDEKERAGQVRLSEKGKVVLAAEKAKRLGAIRARVKTDFYRSREVKEKVVAGLLRDLHGTCA